ncbi:MAG TPA: hypothetical protein VFB14_05520 [Bryobacteraceae bacterium]|jgi:hypothetical protein|nr:hypothetical protein [Bryobacteraceae bacterium]
MPDPTCSVLVVSCDRYSDLWQPFFSQFWRYWPDCPFPVYLGLNQERYRDARVRVIQAGEDRSWSSNLRSFLNQTDSTYVLLLLEDFFLSKAVQTGEVLRHLGALDALHGTMLRLVPNPPPNTRISAYSSFGSIHPSAPYRVSAQAAIWKRTGLLDVLDDRENPWEFESNATARSRLYRDGFFCSYRPLLPYRHVVERGEWFWSAARFYKKQNIGCDFEARPVMTPTTALRKYINGRCRYWRDRISALRLIEGQRNSPGAAHG